VRVGSLESPSGCSAEIGAGSPNLFQWRAPIQRRSKARGPPGQVPAAFVEEELRDYLECGILCFGFARALCTGCRQGFVVAFSCQGRGVCPFCNGRHMAQTGPRGQGCLHPTTGSERCRTRPTHVGKLRTGTRSAQTREKRQQSGCGALRETRSGRPGRSSRGSRVVHQPEDRCCSAVDRAILHHQLSACGGKFSNLPNATPGHRGRPVAWFNVCACPSVIRVTACQRAACGTGGSEPK